MNKSKHLAKILFLFFAIASFSLVIVSCNKDDDEDDKTAFKTLTSNAWHLKQFVEGDTIIYPKYYEDKEDSTLYIIKFYSNFTFTIYAYANWYDGEFALNAKSNKINMAIGFHTQVGDNGYDTRMIESMLEVYKYKFVKGKLHLHYDTDKYMEFEKVNLNVWNSKN